MQLQNITEVMMMALLLFLLFLLVHGWYGAQLFQNSRHFINVECWINIEGKIIGEAFLASLTESLALRDYQTNDYFMEILPPTFRISSTSTIGNDRILN